MTPSFSRTARLVVEALGQEVVLIGGLAVAAYGHERATKDVDFITRLPLREAQKRLEARGFSVEVRRGDAEEGVPTFLRTNVSGTPVDVLPALARIDWDHLPEVVLDGVSVKLVDLDTLILLKTRAGGVQDMLDVAQLVWRHPDHLPLARDLADRYGVRPRLEGCLADRRERRRYLDSVPRSTRAQRRAEIDRLIPLP
jgi:hypothetical protein